MVAPCDTRNDLQMRWITGVKGMILTETSTTHMVLIGTVYSIYMYMIVYAYIIIYCIYIYYISILYMHVMYIYIYIHTYYIHIHVCIKTYQTKTYHNNSQGGWFTPWHPNSRVRRVFHWDPIWPKKLMHRDVAMVCHGICRSMTWMCDQTLFAYQGQRQNISRLWVCNYNHAYHASYLQSIYWSSIPR